jgi:rare lipoprotein A
MITAKSVARLVAVATLSMPLAGCILLPFDLASDLDPMTSRIVMSTVSMPAKKPVAHVSKPLVASSLAGMRLTGSDFPPERPALIAQSDAPTTLPASSYSSTGSVGVASYYGSEFHGRRKANGEIFDMNEMTAAHPTLPFGTRVRVTNLSNGRTVIVRISDRGPFTRGRMVDVSFAAAKALDFVSDGITRVKMERL